MTPEGELLSLSPDELLSTTRAVRKRLDFTRPVPDEVIRDCVRLAMQAPAGSNIPRTRYLDRLSRRANTWRIDHRTVVLDWHKTEVWTESAPQVPTDGFARGARGPEDPSYAGYSLARK